MSTSPIGRKPPGKPVPRTARAGRAALPTLHAGLAARPDPLPASAEAPGAGTGERAALRAHVEKTLLGLFGSQLALSPRFQDIVAETVDALLAEPALQATVQQACKDLLAAQAGGPGRV